jgi:hypothetical protein
MMIIEMFPSSHAKEPPTTVVSATQQSSIQELAKVHILVCYNLLKKDAYIQIRLNRLKSIFQVRLYLLLVLEHQCLEQAV